MTTLERIDADFKEAMKTRNELALSILRLARTALKNKQIDSQHELDDAEVQVVLKTMIKQYQDALSDFNNAGRRDLAERQQMEIDLLVSYLPPALPQEELERIVTEAVKASGATDVGKAIGAAMKVLEGRADGNAVRLIVQKVLGS